VVQRIVSSIQVFTSAAANYLPKVLTLAASLRRFHPDWQFSVLLIEDMPAGDLPELEGINIVPLADLAIPNWRPWAFCHDIVELSTAAKPYMLRHLLAMPQTEVVLYIDPDIAVFSPLDDLLEATNKASILLTPHQTTPEEGLEQVVTQELTSLRCGIYNLGFIGVKRDAVGCAFADWWAERLYHFCRDQIEQGLFTDQRWIDLVPALFPQVEILRSPRFNVAAWNFSMRCLKAPAASADQWTVNDEPLGFYHFTGIDSDKHNLMLTKLCCCPDAVADLLAWYRAEVAQWENLPALRGIKSAPWTLSHYSSGEPIPGAVRVCYRDSPELQARYPDPWRYEGLGAWAAQRDIEALALEASQSLSLGYVAGENPVDVAKINAYLWRGLLNPKLGRSMLSRAYRIWQQEGVRGVRRRLRK
jgi:hypothetical protein